jgi:hypothetical protein
MGCNFVVIEFALRQPECQFDGERFRLDGASCMLLSSNRAGCGEKQCAQQKAGDYGDLVAEDGVGDRQHAQDPGTRELCSGCQIDAEAGCFDGYLLSLNAVLPNQCSGTPLFPPRRVNHYCKRWSRRIRIGPWAYPVMELNEVVTEFSSGGEETFSGRCGFDAPAKWLARIGVGPLFSSEWRELQDSGAILFRPHRMRW